jgi:hypothetical protein
MSSWCVPTAPIDASSSYRSGALHEARIHHKEHQGHKEGLGDGRGFVTLVIFVVNIL